jgi:hypothetical protein
MDRFNVLSFVPPSRAAENIFQSLQWSDRIRELVVVEDERKISLHRLDKRFDLVILDSCFWGSPTNTATFVQLLRENGFSKPIIAVETKNNTADRLTLGIGGCNFIIPHPLVAVEASSTPTIIREEVEAIIKQMMRFSTTVLRFLIPYPKIRQINEEREAALPAPGRSPRINT